MHNLQITGGDLTLSRTGSSTHLSSVNGKAKLTQDLNIWLLTQYGISYSAPNFGSRLNDFIGQYDPPALLPAVQQEVQRLLTLYQQNQANLLIQAQSRNTLGVWTKDQIIQSINSVQAVTQATSIAVTVLITTLAGSQQILNIQISPSSISVS